MRFFTKKPCYHQGFFAVKRREVFILGAKWIALVKRVAEGLCGWRHGNSFPMAQNAQSHRQMRSIPHCPKAVFYVFVFHSILNSAIKNNHCPPVFSTEPFYPWLRVERTPASRLAVSSVSVAVSMLVESKRSWALL